MFATARLASALALVGAIILGGASPALASDRDKLTAVDFTLAAAGPFVPSVGSAINSDVAAEPKTTALADAVQTRPIDIAVPRVGSGATSLRRSMYVSFAALQVLDAMSTTKALATGATEANPAIN
ncbi:MAG: hypothetical protein ABIP65_02130, partial [Vicinamibacterales bacterium]